MSDSKQTIFNRPSPRKPYLQPQPRNWWLKNPAYRFYMLREATAIPLLLYTLVLLCGVYQLTQGEQAFTRWLVWLQSPLALLLHTLALVAALLHTTTWFALVPKILVIHTDKFKVDGKYVQLAHWLGAVVCFIVLLVLALVGLALVPFGSTNV